MAAGHASRARPASTPTWPRRPAFLLGDARPRLARRARPARPLPRARRRGRRERDLAPAHGGGAGVHLTSSPAIWYAARASGVAAYVVLSVVVALGLGLGGKAQSRALAALLGRGRPPLRRPARRLADRRSTSLTIAVDSFLPFSRHAARRAVHRHVPADLDGARDRRRRAPARARDHEPLPASRLPYRFWRTAHYLNFAVWTLASLHGLLVGTDRGATWLALLYGSRWRAVVHALLWRFGGLVLRSPGVATAGAVTVVALPVLYPRAAAPRRPSLERCARERAADGQVIRNGTNLKQIVSFVGQAQEPAEAARARRPARLAADARHDVAPARVPAERRHLPRAA